MSREQFTNHLGQPIGKPVPAWQPPMTPERRVIEGAWCRLEPLDAGAHAASLHAAYSADPEGRNWTYLPYGPFPTFDAFSTWLDSIVEGDDPQFYAVLPADQEAAAGLLSFLRITPPQGTIEVGHIHFAESMKRTPAATEAIFLTMKTAFALGYRRFEWKCDALNATSCAAARRLGFSFDGLFRQALVYKDRNRDTAWFSVLDHEWPALRTAFEQWLSPANFDTEGRQRESLRELTAPLLREPATH